MWKSWTSNYFLTKTSSLFRNIVNIFDGKCYFQYFILKYYEKPRELYFFLESLTSMAFFFYCYFFIRTETLPERNAHQNRKFRCKPFFKEPNIRIFRSFKEQNSYENRIFRCNPFFKKPNIRFYKEPFAKRTESLRQIESFGSLKNVIHKSVDYIRFFTESTTSLN